MEEREGEREKRRMRKEQPELLTISVWGCGIGFRSKAIIDKDGVIVCPGAALLAVGFLPTL